MFIWQGRVRVAKAARRQRATWQSLMSGRFRAGQWNKGKGKRGFTFSGGCMQNFFCRFGKISLGFCNQTFLQYGCKRVFISFRDVCWAPPADLGKSRWGLAIMHPYQFGVKWGSITGLHRLSWVNLGGVPVVIYMGVGNADQSW